MANEKDDEQIGKQSQEKELGENKQQPTGQQGQQPTDQQGQSSSGQADPGRSGETETLSTERGFGQGAGEASGGTEGVGGFVGSQGSGSSDYLREEGATAGSDFASQSQGALEGQDEDVETGQRRTPNPDIEGGTGA